MSTPEPRTLPRRRAAARWRRFTAHQIRRIDHQMEDGQSPCCPCCDLHLHPRLESRRAAELVLDAVGYDLDCPACRRFRSVLFHTERSLRFVRMRRLAAAVHAGHIPRRAPRASVA